MHISYDLVQQKLALVISS